MSKIHMVTREEMLRDMADPGRKDRERLRAIEKDNREMSAKYIDALLALSHLTGHKPPAKINRKCLWRAEEFIRRFKADENLLIGNGPNLKD